MTPERLEEIRKIELADWTEFHKDTIDLAAKDSGTDLTALGLDSAEIAQEVCDFERLGKVPGPQMVRAAEVLPHGPERSVAKETLYSLCAWHRNR